MSPTARKVYVATSKIPRGRVSTYRAIAREIGKERAARAVGGILRSNPWPIKVPCHRVVKSDGSIGGYGGAAGAPRKIKLLASEGVNVRRGHIQDFEKVMFAEFRSSHSSTKK